jgi:hypothetical protein
VIGGAEIYRQTLPLASRLIITEIAATFDCDAFFPESDANVWQETERENHVSGKHETVSTLLLHCAARQTLPTQINLKATRYVWSRFSRSRPARPRGTRRPWQRWLFQQHCRDDGDPGHRRRAFGYLGGATQNDAALFKNNAAIDKTQAANSWNYYQAKSASKTWPSWP